MSAQDTIAKIERRMDSLRVEIDAINARLAPVDAEIDALLAKEQEVQAQIRALLPKLDEARGMPPEQYLKLKRDFGQLAALRMQMRATAGLIDA